MKAAFFISDVHLHRMASPTGEAMLSLVRKAQKEAELFVILGDLFEIWVGEGSAFQREYRPLLDEFKRLREKTRVIYFEGNHDFHLQRFWKDQLDCEILTRPKLIEFHGMKIWAEHGDEINRKDVGYLFLRKLLHTNPVPFFIESLPSYLVMKLGARASDASRKYRKDPSDIIQIFRDYAVNLRGSYDFDLLLAGHSHFADDYKFEFQGKPARLINLGSWFDGPHYLKISEGKIEHLTV